MCGEHGRVRIVEHHGDREPLARRRVQSVAQLHRGEGVEPEIAERPVGLHGLRPRVTEHGGDLGAHQVHECAVLFGRRQRGQPPLQVGVTVLGVGLVLRVEDLAHVGNLVQQWTRTRGGEHGSEARPVDVGDGEERVVLFESLLQAGDRQLAPHEGDAAPTQLFLHDVHGHAAPVVARRPDTPGDRRARESSRPPVLGERVEIGVGGGVGTVVTAAPHARDGRVQHERVERVLVEDRVQVARTGELGVRALGELVERAVGQRHQQADPGGVDDHPDVVAVVGELPHQRVERVAVGDVAGGEGDLGAEFLQLGGEFPRAGRVGAPPAKQYQVLDATASEPARGLRAEPAVAARDERGAARLPRRPRRGTAERCPLQPSQVETRAAHGELVLGAHTGEHAAQQSQRVIVELRRQVDEAAPAFRVFEGDDPAQPPGGVLQRVGQRIAVADRHGGVRGDPQLRVDRRVDECLHEQQRRHETVGQLRVCRVRTLVEREQRQHSGGPLARGGGRQQAREAGTVGVGVAHDHGHDVGAALGECLAHRVGPLAVVLRQHEQPGAREPVGGDHAQVTAPRDPVAPLVHCGALVLRPAPVAQRGQYRVERLTVDGQFVGERGIVESGPERVVAAAFRRERRWGEPVVLVLEGVGGQLHALAVQPVGPAGHQPRDVEGGERGEEPPGAAVVTAQRAGDHGGTCRVECVESVLHSRRQHGVWADLDERVVALLGEFPHGRGEADGAAQVAVPVVAVEFGGVDPVAGDGGEERDLRLLRRDRSEQLAQPLLDVGDLRGVRRVVHGHAPVADLLGVERGGQLVERVRLTGDHDGRRSVDGGQRQPLAPGRQPFGDDLGGFGDRQHAAAAGEAVTDRLAAQSHHAGGVGQAQCPGHARGRDLALRVPDDGGGFDPVGPPQRGERHEHGEQRRLHDVDAVERRGARLTA